MEGRLEKDLEAGQETDLANREETDLETDLGAHITARLERDSGNEENIL